MASLERLDADRVALDEQAERYRSMVSAAVELIREGDVYQINLARRLDFEARGDALSMLLRMSETVRAPYAAAFELPNELSVISTSPELLLQTDAARQVLTVPIKGTRPRTGDTAADARTASELEHDVKELAELAMVVDVERNDVGRVAEYGSVIAETPRVLPYSTVFHRLARVRGVASENVSRRQVLEALLPSGSVTGAPKIRAMELIAQLEEHRRGLYTGALGYISHDGCVNLGMAIRCLVTREREAHYHVGGGIVIRSDPQRELEETFWKAEQVLRVQSRT
jgi:para-aminobenzoate synthetase